MQGAYRVRPARMADVEGIAFVHFTAWGESYRGLIPDASLDARAPVEARVRSWRDYLQRGLGSMWVATDATDTVVGFAACSGPEPHTDAESELQAIYLLAAHNRRGVGTALLEAAFHHLRESGKRSVGLWVLDANAAACAFYEAQGATRGADRINPRNLKLRSYYWSLAQPHSDAVG